MLDKLLSNPPHSRAFSFVTCCCCFVLLLTSLALPVRSCCRYRRWVLCGALTLSGLNTFAERASLLAFACLMGLPLLNTFQPGLRPPTSFTASWLLPATPLGMGWITPLPPSAAPKAATAATAAASCQEGESTAAEDASVVGDGDSTH